MADTPVGVLLVDDEESLRQPLASWLTREYGYKVEMAASGLEAISLIQANPGCFDVVLLDYLLPAPYNGLTLMEEIKHRCLDTETAFIIFTGWGLDPQVGVKALKAGAYRYLAKPFDREELAILIQSIVETRHTRAALEATAREKAWLESLFELSQIVNSTLRLDKVLELILDVLKQVVAYDSATIQRVTSEGLQVIACRGFPEPHQLIGRIFPPSEANPNYWVWRSKQPLIEGDMRSTYHTQRVRGWLGVPLIYRGEVIGIITLDSQTPNFYIPDNARVATIFANQAAIAMENARLFSETQRRLDDLNKVHQASQVIVSHLDMHQVLKEVVKLAAEVAGSDNTSVVLVDDTGRLIDSVETITTAYQDIPPLHERARPQGKTWQVLTTGEPFIANQIDRAAGHNPYLLETGVASYLGLPLKAKRNVVGVLFVHSFAPNAFSEEQIALLTTFANQAAVAIENARLYDREVRRAETLRALLEVQQEVTRTITTQSKILLNKIACTACQVTGADCAVIYPYMAESGKYDLANLAAYGLYGDLTYQEKQRLGQGDSVSSLVLREGRILIYDAAQEDPRLLQHSFINREGIEAFVGIRLEATDPVGILFVNYRRPHAWAEDEIALIDLFAGQAAVAILNGRLFGRTNEKLERKVAELHAVGEINRRITATLDLNEMLPLILNKAMELVNVPNGALQLIDEDTGELVLRLCYGPMLKPLEQTRLKLGEGITGKAAQEKRSIVVYDVTQPPWQEIYREFRPHIRSELAVPLLIGEQCLGVLNFEHNQPHYFSEDQCEIVEALANQAAIAIQNAQRYDELARTRSSLDATEAVAWIGLFGSSWAHSVTQKTAAARNYLAVLADYLPPDEKAHHLLDKVEEVMRAIHEIPIAQPLPAKPQMTTKLDLDAALKEQVPRWCRAHPRVKLVLDLHCPGLRAHIDKEWLDVAMEKLINNALKVMPDGGQLKITTRPHNGQIEMSITDTGQGLSEKIRPYFLKQQIPKQFASGSGIGALIAKIVFRAFGGDLELLWSERERGTALQVVLPASPVTAPNPIIQLPGG
jgi:GAF domain-containing protein/ActR/RegA family two-component response regulator